MDIVCVCVCVVVRFYSWFKFYFPLFQTHHHALRYPKKFEPQHTVAYISCGLRNFKKFD